MKTLKLAGFIVVVASLVGCKIEPAKPLPPPPAAKILTFTATPAVVRAGGTTTLAWTTESATAALLQQAGGDDLTPAGAPTSGSVTVTINAPAAFLLSAQGEGGTDAKVVAVSLEGSDGAPLFSAIPARINGGESTTLIWNTSAAATISAVGGAALDLKGQTTSGSVQVTPSKTTQYRLTAGSAMATVDVAVTPVISSFGLAGAAPLPGGMAMLSWTTKGATKVTLRRVGAAAPVEVVTDAARVAAGSSTDTVAQTALVNSELTYQLDAESGTEHALLSTIVTVGGGVKITRFDLPAYGVWGGTASATWTTTGATSVQVLVDGKPLYESGATADVTNGQTAIASPMASAVVTLIARNGRGDEARAERTIAGIGQIGFNSFTADKLAIDGGGEAVVLSWDVTNARKVRIFELDGGTGEFRSVSGTAAETGSVTVYPNQANTAYQLVADNGAGQTVSSPQVTINVATPATLQFSRQLPPGGSVNLTGSTLAGATVIGVPRAEAAPMGEAFIDIDQTGAAFSFGTFADAKATIPSFDTVVYGRRVRRQTNVAVCMHGYLEFSSSFITSVSATNTPQFGTTLAPLTIAPYWQGMTAGIGRVTWQLDDLPTDQRLIIQWTGMQPLGTTQKVTFQAQVYRSGKIVFAYRDFVGVTASTATVGIVNGSKTDEVHPSTAPTGSSVFRFFAAEAPGAIVVEAAPFVARAKLANGSLVDLEGDPRIPVGQFAITEVHSRPLSSLTNAQWFEVKNFTDGGIDLGGWTVEFSPMNTFTIPMNTVIPANGRSVFAQSNVLGDSSANVMANVVYPSTFVMPDAGSSLRLLFQGLAYQSMSYTTAVPAGRSLQAEEARNPSALYASAATDSCASTTAMGTGGQFGTPGAANLFCLPFSKAPLATPNFERLEGRGQPLITSFTTCADAGLHICGSTPLDESVYFLDAGIPGVGGGSIYVSTNGWISTKPVTSAHSSEKTAPSTTAPTGVMAPFWDDLDGYKSDAGVVTGIYYERNSNYSTVSWENFRPWNVSGVISMNFQVKIFDDGHLEYHYGDFTVTDVDGGVASASTTARVRGSSATAWIESPTGSQAIVGFIQDAGVPANGGYNFPRQ